MHAVSRIEAGPARGLAPETGRWPKPSASAIVTDLYAAAHVRIEQRLAKRHLDDGALVLYDLTSVYLEGRNCPLAQRGHSRDGKRGKLQIEGPGNAGCPVAVEVFDGNTADRPPWACRSTSSDVVSCRTGAC